MESEERRAIAVIGAGTLGWQIALTFAARGVSVRLHDVSPQALQAGIERIRLETAAFIVIGELPAEAAQTADRLIPCDSLLGAVEGVWLVIEAIPERLDLKRAFYAELSAITGPDVILATNSSSYQSRELADVTRHPAHGHLER